MSDQSHPPTDRRQTLTDHPTAIMSRYLLLLGLFALGSAENEPESGPAAAQAEETVVPQQELASVLINLFRPDGEDSNPVQLGPSGVAGLLQALLSVLNRDIVPAGGGIVPAGVDNGLAFARILSMMQAAGGGIGAAGGGIGAAGGGNGAAGGGNGAAGGGIGAAGGGIGAAAGGNGAAGGGNGAAGGGIGAAAGGNGAAAGGNGAAAGGNGAAGGGLMEPDPFLNVIALMNPEERANMMTILINRMAQTSDD